MEKTITPTLQKTVAFYGDELVAVRDDEGQVFVSLRHMCQALGLNVQAQRRRIERHTVMQNGFMVAMMATIKGKRPSHVLRVDLVPLWLSGTDASRVKDEIRAKLEQYQREAAKVLWEAFQDGRLSVDPSFEELLQQDTDAVQAYKMALAIVKLARNQILMESRLDAHDVRLAQLEAQLEQSDRVITEEQASQVSQAVKAIARELTGRTGHNEYGGVYGELYRQFGVTSYKLIPAKRFEEVMSWLTTWFQDLTDAVDF
ncbi:MAG: hypothetical protein DWQ04_15945 [Chloroflexi bacterium]|nr:MAG: hypothetical protein DWQ04_15945 [Chloroflexota bacterium]